MTKCKLLAKGIVRHDDKYLIVAKWYDDCISDPFRWQFIDGEVEHGESPDAAVLRLIQIQTGLNAEINKIVYTWSFMVGDTHKVGIAYECLTNEEAVILAEDLNQSKWITREEFEEYIENISVLKDFSKAEY